MEGFRQGNDYLQPVARHETLRAHLSCLTGSANSAGA